MQANYAEISSIVGEKNLIDKLKTNKVLLGAVIFAVVVLIYFVSLNFLDPSDTQVIIQDSIPSKPELVKELVVHISGAVKKPGVYKIKENSRVADVVNKAGGITDNADEEWVTKQLNLSLLVSDQQKIYIPFDWDSRAEVEQNLEQISRISEPATKTSNEPVSEEPSDSSENKNTINVNKASKDLLKGLSGIGEVYAQRIIDSRPYSGMSELETKTEIPSTTLEKIEKDITF